MINEVQEILINESEIQEKVKYLAEFQATEVRLFPVN